MNIYVDNTNYDEISPIGEVIKNCNTEDISKSYIHSLILVFRSGKTMEYNIDEFLCLYPAFDESLFSDEQDRQNLEELFGEVSLFKVLVNNEKLRKDTREILYKTIWKAKHGTTK